MFNLACFRPPIRLLHRLSFVRCYSEEAATISQNTDHRSSAPTSEHSSALILHIPKSSIYSLGDSSGISEPLLRDVSWTVRPNEAWAIVTAGYGSSKRTLLKALIGQRRIDPFPPDGIFPFIKHKDLASHVVLVSSGRNTPGAEFYDYTARYGAIRDGDKKTLREAYFTESGPSTDKLAIPSLHERRRVDGSTHSKKQTLFKKLIRDLGLSKLLELPVVALSNGQMRLVRIAKALLRQPSLLLLDEPLTGLDVDTRSLLVRFLRRLHFSSDPSNPHVILGMRPNDPLPDWITHVALVTSEHTVLTGTKQELASEIEGKFRANLGLHHTTQQGERKLGYEIIRVSDLNLSYGDRQVLKNVNWTIHENSRWHLMGDNGAGKTTLLAMITGEHPQSFTHADCLRILGRQRDSWPTVALNGRIGRTSPELHHAFPRRPGMTVWDVVGTGFHGEFVPRGRLHVGMNADGTSLEPAGRVETWRVRRMWQVLEGLGPRSWAGRVADGDYEAEEDKAFAKRHFVDLSPGEQSIVLLMRALVGRQQLVLLDEVWSGMDDGMVQAVRRYLADGGRGLLPTQACVIINHFEEEVPWTRQEGLQRLLLKDGEAHEVK
ncbi:P-loop containing nucleoside triphosphate hydrolase protein [Laetiporus sulphureus 93-53]|uniref:p-loop containing nucleoside triphosphate hydrolase protein n=1 Tax=Laetiporus sulphureus 93-53 TaxID=1314785 RepID=A0A165AVV6_9APHY|nr:P-loop containing nucleoside triphosphate hydrolase protein [Laetiporus sulphureus 93-53]KZS99763.1 P-loop containing nucleoside triphosphate hydrolase protein [Laetiporus sulphureus 93-53]